MFVLFKSAFSLFKVAYSLSEEMNWVGTPAGRKRLGGLLWEVNKSLASESSIDKAVDELREFTKSGVPEGLTDSAAGESTNWLRNIALNTPYANWGSLKGIAIQAKKDLLFYWDNRPKIIEALGPQASQLSGIASLSELDKIISKFGSIRIEKLNKSRDPKEAGGVWNLGTSGDWQVDVPYNREGAAVLGHKTSWCTARQDPSGDYPFDKYHNPSVGMYLYVFTNNRTGDRYQAFFDHNSLEVRDEQDAMVSSDLAIQLWNVLKSLKNLPEGSPVENGSLERTELADEMDDGSASTLRLKRTVKYLNAKDELHREDGPAIVRPNGSEEWYQGGELHREGGPAIVRPDGSEEWYLNGKRHREGGPAIIKSNGEQHWYRNGKLHRDDGPASIIPGGVKSWYQDGKIHRDDGPAVIYPDGTEEWNRNGKIHRDNGPAIIYPDGEQEWYRDGKAIPAPVILEN